MSRLRLIKSEQIIIHLTQPHQADHVFDAQRICKHALTHVFGNLCTAISHGKYLREGLCQS